jgi:hypothetical protein
MSTLDKNRLDEVFEALQQNIQCLTSWEQSFVEDVYDQYERSGSLSEKQLDILEKAYLKIP